MRPTPANINVQGGFGGQKVELSFDQSSIAHLMRVLTDLYSDPTLAVIREYSTNALDSHFAAGNPDPINISLPGVMGRFFVVEDKGVGLSSDDLINIYSKYGASTKRDTDDQVGMLGLGAKSALTYCDQFSITAVKDGRKTLVNVSRTESGGGALEIISETSTSEPNGVTIKIPVHDSYQFVQKANEFYRFWNPAHVLVDGKAPTGLQDAKEVHPGIFMVPDLNTDYVVMGNVPYPLDSNNYSLSDQTRWYHKYGVVAHVKIGELDFTPSREAIHYTAKSISTIRQYARLFQTYFKQYAEADMRKAKTNFEAVQKMREWIKLIPNMDFRYNGKQIPKHFQKLKLIETFNRWGSNTNKSNYVDFDRLFNMVNEFGGWDRLYFIPDYDRDKVAPSHRAKAKQWLVENTTHGDKDAAVFFFSEEPDTEGWLSGIQRIKWDDVFKTKIPRQPRAGQAQGGEYYPVSVKVDGKRPYTSSTSRVVDKAKPIYYIAKDRPNPQVEVFDILPKDAQVVSLAPRRENKFLRLHPTAKPLAPVLRKHAEDYVKNLPQQTVEMMNRFKMGKMGVFNYLDAARVDDPDFADAIRRAKVVRQEIENYNAMQRIVNPYGVSVTLPQGTGLDIDFDERYPLVSGATHRGDAVYRYITAMYNHFYKEDAE